MPLIINTFDIPKVKPYVPKELPEYPGCKVKSEQLIGIEVEMENAHLIGDVHRVWRMEEDGSLRNGGMEFITFPIPAKFAPDALHQLMTVALDPKTCSCSPRTSVHIHLNVQDLETSQAIDLVLLYCLFERMLYRFAGRGRMKNIYCVPILETNLIDFFSQRGVAVDWYKYTGLNLLTLRNYGTMEFRHMHGTTDVEKLSVWINLITSLKEYVLTHSTKEIRTMIHGMDDSFDFKKLGTDIFGEFYDYLKASSVEDMRFSYMTTKLATADTRIAARLRQTVTASSFFYKGQT